MQRIFASFTKKIAAVKNDVYLRITTYHSQYFYCLEDWSDEMKEARGHKEAWFSKIKDLNGLLPDHY